MKSSSSRAWTFLTNHGHALVAIAQNPDARLRDIASAIGVTERTAQSIVEDLVEAGYLARLRRGNRNHYRLDPARPFRHPLERDHAVGGLIAILVPEGTGRPMDIHDDDSG